MECRNVRSPSILYIGTLPRDVMCKAERKGNKILLVVILTLCILKSKRRRMDVFTCQSSSSMLVWSTAGSDEAS